MSKIRECIICGTKHEYCPNCKKYNSNEQWRMLYCSENCMAIDKIRDKYKAGTYDKSQARVKLRQLDVPSIENIKEWCRDTISEIIGVEINVPVPVLETVEETVEEIVVEETPIEETIEEIVETDEIQKVEEVKETTNNYSLDYKRNKKKR